MDKQVHVEIEALEALRRALLGASSNIKGALARFQREIVRTQQWLSERVAFWEREVHRRQTELDQAQAALARCLASGTRDPKTGAYISPPCTAERRWVAAATQKLNQAQRELEHVRAWKRRVDEAVSQYSVQANAFDRKVASDLPNAAAFLAGCIRDLHTYAASSDIAASPPDVPSPNLNDSFPGLTTSSSTLPPRPQSGRPQSGQSAATGPSRVSGTGGSQLPLQEVNIDKIDLSSSPVTSSQDFHKVSYQEMVEGLQKWQNVVAPAVAQGADGDYFSQLDATLGHDYAHGYRRIYDAFYGQDCIKLEQVGDRFIVINGYHRLFVARKLGITALPAQIVKRR